MDEPIISEIAVIFKRVKSEFDLVEEFIPYKVVEGYLYEEEESFIDYEQNVYPHMASLASVGNVFAGRASIYEVMKKNENMTLSEIKTRLLTYLEGFTYYKNIDDTSSEYNIIKAKNKQTDEVKIFVDQETATYYEMYQALRDYSKNNIANKVSSKIKEQSEIKKISENENNTNNEICMSRKPIDIINEIKKTIKGQDAAIETIITNLWIKYNFKDVPKANMLLIGPSGVGKTAIFKKLKQILDVPVAMFSIPGVSQAGYKGHDIDEMLTELYILSNENIEKAEKGIIFIDEFDKLAANRDSGEIGTIAVQNELLKIIEGCTRTVSIDNHRTFNIDTSNITFVCCGAFSELYEEKNTHKPVGFNSTYQELPKIKVTTESIIKYGIIRELAGRLPIIIELNDLNNNKEILKEILLNSDESIFSSIISAINNEGVNIQNISELADLIVDKAIKRKIGARGLISPTRNIFLKIIYEIANNPGKYESVIIGTNIMEDNNDFELIPKQVKRKIKTDLTVQG